MILIADSGSTKTSWCVLHSNNERQYFETEGYNPYFVDTGYIVESLTQHLPPGISFSEIFEVHYYGAGCFPGKDFVLSDALTTVFGHSKIFIELDLLAAARSLLGTNRGFAAILGTGMNTCIYDGENIVQNIDSLGYVLGDEGSGAAMGKHLLSDYIRGFMPKEISQLVYATFQMDKEDIFDHLYAQPLANRFCAAYSKFIHQHIEKAYFYHLVKASFGDLFNNLVTKYPDYKSYSFNCVGSVGFHFKDILNEVVEQFGMQKGNIIQSPLEGLVAYHQKRTLPYEG